MSKTAITPTRADNFPEWYQQVIKAADMAENAPVRGCMILKPYGCALWEQIQSQFDARIKDEEVHNAYFPLLIPLSYIAQEAQHIEGFAKECAVVTHHRLVSDGHGGLKPDPEAQLTEPMIIRPTSETIIGEAMARWVRSYRDLPLKLNQWANVMRWEMRPRIFLRTSEFLWQEGHNAWATEHEAQADAARMLDVYRLFLTDVLAMPGFSGTKTPEERFPGAVDTLTIEAIMQDGKALQACTSHHLGQTFTQSAGITYLDQDGQEKTAWSTSWGMSTRTIGGMIMCHADDDGMVMPPYIAPEQIRIVPMIRNDADRDVLLAYCNELAQQCRQAGFRVGVDKSHARGPDKMWRAVKQGVPLRVDVGMRECEAKTVSCVRRDQGKAGQFSMDVASFVQAIPEQLKALHEALITRVQERLQAVPVITTLADYQAWCDSGASGGALLPEALNHDREVQRVHQQHSITERCLPFDHPGHVLVGKAY